MTEQLEYRVTKLEDEMAEALAIAREARHDAAMAETGARGAFALAEDLRAMLRAHTKSLNALRETQFEHGQHLDRLEGKVDRLDLKFDEGFTAMSLGMSEITAILNNLERG